MDDSPTLSLSEKTAKELENLSQCLNKLRVNYDTRVNDDDSSPKTMSSQQQVSPTPASAPVAVPLYSESMWAVHSSSDEPGDSASLNPQYETITSSDFRSPLESLANPFHSPAYRVLPLAQDQRGSEYLMEILSSGENRIIDEILEEVLMFTFELMNHQYGRLVFGKLIESCNEHQLMMITLNITSQDQLFLRASADRYGSSSIKKLIKVLGGSPLMYEVTSTLKRLFKFLMVSKSGSSIILQCLGSPYNQKNDFIYQAALEHCLTLACHKQGCIYINKFIEAMRGSRRKQILHLISVNAASLSRNPFGNYVVQHVLKLENPESMATICSALRGHFVDLSMRKGGSYVVQTCLKYQDIAHYIVEELLSSNQIFEVAKDIHGNYVIQTALEETLRVNRLDLHHRLVTQLQQNLTALRFGHGKHVYNLIAK